MEGAGERGKRRDEDGKRCARKPLSSREVGVASGKGVWLLLSDFDVVGRKESVRPPAHASPPALVNHLDVGDDVIGIKGDLVVASYKHEHTDISM